jgi:glycosyltransferase involved in cell wall biosynthesis
VRDRSGIRTENCLRSLRWQDADPERVEILISDLGSTVDHLSAIRRLSADYGARVIETPTPGLWNRSKALNVGIQAARGDVVLCTDTDMIFQQNFLSTILAEDDCFRGRSMVLCRCWDLPASVPERQWGGEDFSSLKAKAQLRPTPGTGACQAAGRAFFEHCRGYDEKMRYWGSEDTDMVSRARRYGLDFRWISDRTSMLHQWHPTRKHDHSVTVYLNRVRHRLTRHVVVKNRSGWGIR